MGTLEKFIAGAFLLIAIYLFVWNAENTSRVISAFAEGSSNIFATLQGRGGFGAGRLTGIGF